MQNAKRRYGKWLLFGSAGLLVFIQAIPYGRAHTNPPVIVEPAWSTPQVRVLAQRACFDCHSNSTRWPWYSHVAPISWLVQYDTDEGRKKLNLSEWNLPQREADEASEVVREGEMPPAIYLVTHPEARLSDAERQTLADGLAKSLGGF